MKILNILISLMLLLCLSSSIFAQDGIVKFDYGTNKWMELHFLFQAWGLFEEQYNTDKNRDPYSESTIDKSFLIRRARIILNGQASERVTFFYESDDLNAGETESTDRNSSTNGMYTQDAFINYKLAEELQIAVGMILLPFMHNNRQSAVSTLGIDYNTTFIESGMHGPDNIWRDNGLEARGLLAGGALDYRIGVFQGRDRTLNAGNTHDYPRYCGRLQLNFLEPETGFFYSGNYLGKKKIFSLGGGIDYQQNVFVEPDNGKRENYMAWTADLYLDYPIGLQNGINIQIAFLKVANCPETYSSEGNRDSYGFFFQIGVLLFKKLQPFIKYYEVTAEGTTSEGDFKTSHLVGGGNFFINGHNANIKMEYQYPMGDNKSTVDTATHKSEKRAILQFQIFL